jgi:uroporphyrin-III C-methyltransferase/precorrin-2 dehydrogenase/sirohydrochlorin ferrochelatase/uroporphyrin-III C-methyltransferase
LTVKAMRLIQQADVVVHDRLIGPAILDLAPEGAERHDVGKAPGKPCRSQEEINALLVALAQPGRRVVRLKGGDPYVFGRGSEEALYLLAHGIGVEVVPGITAAGGCAAAAGIPLTHRGIAQGVRFVTGHGRANGDLDLDWDSLADPATTLVVYMGMATAETLSRKLIAAGLPADTPAAAVTHGTLPNQQHVISTLAALPEALIQKGFDSPTLLIIGQVVSLAGPQGNRDGGFVH